MTDTTSQSTNKNTWISHENRVMISIETGLDGYRLRNFYITHGLQWFVWMIFHFSVIFFFTFLLKNVALVWFFLGFANLIAFLIDIPLGILQRYVSTKKLYIIASICQLIAVGIFFWFIFKVFSLLEFASGVITPDSLQSTKDWFFGSAINWIWVLIASICYGLAKELIDVSTFWYILSRANPSQYGSILARNNIVFGIGSVVWLLLSGALLSLNPGLAVILLWLTIIAFLIFTIHYFDNSLDSISIKDIENFKISVQRWNTEHVKEFIVETVKKADIEKVIQWAKYLMIKPKQKTEWNIPWKDIYTSSKKEFRIIWNIFWHRPGYKNLIWTITLVLTFWFWDTFASSFLLDFLDEVKSGWSFVLLAIIWIPWIVLQEQASKLGQKIWTKTVGIVGLVLSWLSLIALGWFAMFDIMNPAVIIWIALINSLGYACGMSTWQNQFLDIYNRIYAEQEKLTEIDANASSGPMKVIQNLANVIWLTFGGILVWFGFPAFFFIFWGVIFAILYMTIVHKDEIQV